MPIYDAGNNVMLDALVPSIDFASAHTADPTSAGNNEVTGGSPAYARKAITYNSAASSNLDSSNTPVFDIPASTTVAWVGFWNLVTAGVIAAAADVTDEVFGGQGTYTLSDADFTIT